VRRPNVIRLAIFAVVVAATWGVLSLGTAVSDPDLEVGDLASQDYRARRARDVVDTVETNARVEEAMASVEPVREISIEVQDSVRENINALFDDVAALSIGEATPTTLPTPTPTTTPAPAVGAAAAPPPAPAELSGVVYLDVEEDGEFLPGAEVERPDRGLAGVTIQIPVAGEVETVVTGH
jgi:membrane-associated HD superfamily phosphohydrolase